MALHLFSPRLIFRAAFAGCVSAISTHRRKSMSKSQRTVLAMLVVAALIAVAVAAVAAAPAPAPASQPQQAATPAPSKGDWNKIKAAGKIIVGTSADYPPFESYNANFKLDGFDIALMQEIAKQLGLKVQFRDMAFDGLSNALQLGQIDAAMAAISITPERDAVVDFSNVYYVGEDAVLAKSGSRITKIASIEDVTNHRIGVQKASIYETWFRDNLVDKGLMESEDLMLYTDVSQAVRDLKAGRIDLVALDAKPAEDYVAQGGVKVVERGKFRQTYGIAVPAGASALQDQLNAALTKLQDQGVVEKLVQKYLKLDPDEVLPVPTPPAVTPTPAPTATPAPEVCVDNASYVADLNYDDKNMTAPPVMQPGQPFTKGWRLRNSGTCTWDQTYTFAFSNGNSPLAQMGGQPVRVNGKVAPGATYDFKVPLTAPTQPGTYQAFWTMEDWQGKPFGDRVWVGITVPGPPTPVPAPTATPAPGIAFWADTYYLTLGQCTTIHWDVQNVKEVYFYQQGESWEGHGVGGKEDRQVCPSQTTTYYLRVVKNDGSVETRELRIDVAAPPSSAPVITSFGVDPSGQLPYGACLQIYWDSQGDINRVSIFYNNQVIWDYAPVRGNMGHCPTQAGAANYRMTASGPGGSAQANANVNVLGPAVTPY
jgi:polar amino acid transport system substrate-binding protein